MSKIYRWARDVFRETARLVLQEECSIQIQKRHSQAKEGDDDTILVQVTEQVIKLVYDSTKRLGYTWIEFLHRSNQVDVAQAVRSALMHGHFLEEQETQDDDETNADHREEDRNVGMDLSTGSNQPNGRTPSTWAACFLSNGQYDTCGLFSIAQQKLSSLDVSLQFPSSITTETDPTGTSETTIVPTNLSSRTDPSTTQQEERWYLLPGKTMSNGMHVPQVSSITDVSNSNMPSYPNNCCNGVFRTPNPTLPVPLLSMDPRQEEWYQSLINKIDESCRRKLMTNGNGLRNSFPSSLEYSWDYIEQAAKAIPERLHFTKSLDYGENGATTITKARARNRCTETIEIVPKSMLKENSAPSNANENDRSPLFMENYGVSYRGDSSSNNNVDGLDNPAAVHPSISEISQSRETPVLLGSKKFHEKLETKKRKRQRAAHAIENFEGNIDVQDLSSQYQNTAKDGEEGRLPSSLKERMVLRWSDIEYEFLDESNDVDSLTNEMIHSEEAEELLNIVNIAKGGLKFVGKFHVMIQSREDGSGRQQSRVSRNKDDIVDVNDDNDEISTESAAENERRVKRQKRKLQKERLGRIESTRGTNSAMNGSGIPSRPQLTKVLRVERKGQEWIELDLGESLVELDVTDIAAAAELDEGISIDAHGSSGESNAAVERGVGIPDSQSRQRTSKLFAFRGLEVSLLLD